jgi:CO/xanthine dehydrogenase Mo-binding subunit
MSRSHETAQRNDAGDVLGGLQHDRVAGAHDRGEVMPPMIAAGKFHGGMTVP